MKESVSAVHLASIVIEGPIERQQEEVGGGRGGAGEDDSQGVSSMRTLDDTDRPECDDELIYVLRLMILL